MFERLIRLLAMMFYAPARAMSEVRDRAPLAPAMLIAFLAQTIFTLYAQWPYLRSAFAARGPFALFSLLFQPFSSLLFLALIFVPVTALVANLLERRGSFSLVIQQEYAALASTIFYAWAAAHLIALPLAMIANVSGFQAEVVANSLKMAGQWQQGMNLPPEARAQLADPQHHTANFLLLLQLPFFALWALIGVREVFRLSIARTLLTLFASALVIFITSPVWTLVFGTVYASPLLLLVLFIFLRGYFGELSRTARARASFKQNLEAATLNPADASAHYNLGLVYQQRNQLDEARQRFERAIEIDPEEVDAHFQLGRLARAENRLPDAIKHYEQVVARDQTHAQYEIWREIGATYIAAGQFEDAREALERFLEYRQLDPEGLYLMGRAHAGLGHSREAANSMQACIEAVKTAPAYKYRAEKRWLNEAQQFIKSSQ